MTVGYMRQASTAGVFTFLSLLFKWKGSVWKSIWHELLIWLWLYFSISIFYRFYLRDTPNGEIFEQLVMFSDSYIKTAASSLTFVLGFYVTHVATRWWNIFMQLPWPDSPCLAIASMLRSKGEQHTSEERRLRRTIVRYLTLSFVLVLRDISERIRRRFPDLTFLMPALMTEEERQRILHASAKEPERACIFWLPIEWVLMILKHCYEQKQLDETHFMFVNRHILNYRNSLNNLLSYDWVCTPLVYTQVVNLATTFYFVMCLLAKQFIANEKAEHEIWKCDYVIPVFTIFEFIFYVGWLKVAQVMLNPFGMDDDDFEVDFLIERNLKIGYCMIDEVFDQAPKLVDVNFEVLPHTKASAKNLAKMNPMVGSVAGMEINRQDAQVISHELLRKHHELMRKGRILAPLNTVKEKEKAEKDKADEKSQLTLSFHSLDNECPMGPSTTSMKVGTSEGILSTLPSRDPEQGSQVPASKEKVDEPAGKPTLSREKATPPDSVKLRPHSTSSKTKKNAGSKMKDVVADKAGEKKEQSRVRGFSRGLSNEVVEKTQAEETSPVRNHHVRQKKSKNNVDATNQSAVRTTDGISRTNSTDKPLSLQRTMSRTTETQEDEKEK